MKIGDRVHAHRMASDSFYKQVIGTLVDVKNGYAVIDADTVMDRWSMSFDRHPSNCRTSARLSDVTSHGTRICDVCDGSGDDPENGDDCHLCEGSGSFDTDGFPSDDA